MVPDSRIDVYVDEPLRAEWEQFVEETDRYHELADLITDAVDAETGYERDDGRTSCRPLCTCGRRGTSEKVQLTVPVDDRRHAAWTRYVENSSAFGSLSHLVTSAVVATVDRARSADPESAGHSSSRKPVCVCARSW